MGDHNQQCSSNKNLVGICNAMVELCSKSLCRICLQDGASLPIFEKSGTGNNIILNISLCLQGEKVEDIDGFPRHICTQCNTTLESLCSFINRYRESSKILEDGLRIVKKEIVYHKSDDHNVTEVKVKRVKIESDDHFDDGFDDIEDEKPLNILKKAKKETFKIKSNKPKKQTGSKTNKIASSILEGNYFWTGEQWCMKIEETTLQKLQRPAKPRPQIKLKGPQTFKKTREPEPKLCDLCGDVFKNQEKLSLHKKNVHFPNPVQCPKCPRVCGTEYYLRRHIKRAHEQSKDFICATCGKRFAFKGELTNHQKKVHDKHLIPKKTFACKLCDKIYKCPKSVLIHERSVHTGQRPAICSICGNSFYHEDYLKEHMRLHTGETPFKCPICGRGYAQRCNMKSHLRIHRVSELDAVTLSKMKPNYLKLLKV